MGCCGDCCIPPKESREPIKHDPEFSGPVKNRSCTDILWLIIFLVFVGLWVYVGFYGIKNGDVRRLLAPMDKQGRKCGLDSDVVNKPYLVFFDITRCLSPDAPFTGCPTEQVCVERCPSETIIFEQRLLTDPASWQTLRSSIVCTYDVNPNEISSAAQMQTLISQEKCTKYVLQSQSVISRCIGDLSTLKCKDKPNSSRSTPLLSSAGLERSGEELCIRKPEVAQSTLMSRATALDSYVGMVVASWVAFFTSNRPEVQNISTQIVEDLVNARWYLLGGVFGVILVCFIYIVLLRWVVAPVVWVSIVGLLALMSFSIYLCYKNFAYYRANPVVVHQTTNIKGWMESIFFKKETWMVLMIVIAVVLLILFLMVVFLRKRITIAIALIKEGSKAVSDIKSTFAFPIFPWAIQCGIIAFGLIVLVYLLSIGESEFSVVRLEEDQDCTCQIYDKNFIPCLPSDFASNCHSIAGGIGAACRNASCHFTGIKSPPIISYMHAVNVVAFFWVMFFIQGLSEMMLASTFATWYWTRNKSNVPFFTLTAGIYRSVRYHMGTVALGALIITIVRLIRLILEYIDHKLKKFDNAFTRCIMCCCKCCFLCLENFLKFINKNAYIMCAIYGKNFCSSARDAFSLLMRNIVRVVVLDKVTDFIFFLSKVLISVGVGFAVYYLLQWNYVYEVTGGTRLHYNYVPAIILSVAAYLITTIFFNVYAMAVDTLFLCFLEDCERNDGSEDKKYFMSRNLMKILGKKNKRE